MNKNYDLIVVGGGAAGMVCAIRAARDAKRVLLLEKLPQVGTKLKATGGGRCNLTNILSNEDFMVKFGRDGRFMQDALREFNYMALIDFFKEIGVETHAPDGFRVFPTSHNSQTIISALVNEMQKLNIEILTSQRVKKVLHAANKIQGVETLNMSFYAPDVILASGGLGYPSLGAEGDGYEIAKELGHSVTKLHPAMMPLYVKEEWVCRCRADTIAKVTIKINLKKHHKFRAIGDLIFTKNGIRGPVVLDAAREITPLLDEFSEVPLLLNLTKGMNEEQLGKYLKDRVSQNPHVDILEILKTLLPAALAYELCIQAGIDAKQSYKKNSSSAKEKLIKLLAWTPIIVTGHDGFKSAMITRGGITLKEIEPKTMQSKIIKGLYFCGEIMNLDGPCGGYNLQWSFASGYLAGGVKKNI